MRTKIWIDTRAMNRSIVGYLLQVILVVAGLPLMVVKLGLCAINTPKSGINQPIAVVRVTVGRSKSCFVEPSLLKEESPRG